MKDLLRFIPGFRSNKNWKKVIAGIYYLFTLLMIFGGMSVFLFFLASPFFITAIIDLIGHKRNNRPITMAAVILLLSFGILTNSLRVTGNNSVSANNKEEPKIENKVDIKEDKKEDLIVSVVPENKDIENNDVEIVENPDESTDVEVEIPEEDNNNFEVVGNLKVHYLDVGQGDSIFIELPNGETALIDGGPKSSGQVVLNYLGNLEVEKIDYLVATHPHEDHIGGLIGVINKYSIGKIYMPKKSHTTKVFEGLLVAIQNKGLKISTPVPGEMILDKEGLSLKILAPEEGISDSNLNNYSVVLKLVYKENSFLFTGDAENKVENGMVNKGYDLKADVLKVGHHGGRTSTTNEFLNKVNPKYAVISLGKGNSYGHPHQETIDRLNNKKIEIFRTDLDGTIVVSSDGTNISFDKKGSSIKGGGNTNTGNEGGNGGSTGTNNIGDVNNEVTKAEPKQEPKPQPPVTDGIEEVYITNTGAKYHKGSCSSISKSKIPISLKEAKEKGYEPCKRCSPPS